VLEELGLAVELTGLVGVYSQRGEAVVLVVYAGTIEAGQPHADGHEVSEVRRFPLDALPHDLAFEHDRRVLADWKRAVQAGTIKIEMRQRLDGSN
jgi:ADP-ribose pyrophosphatase YjhB (NUDIX family)